MKKRERLTTRLAAAAGEKEKKKPSNGEMQRNRDGFEYDKSKATVLKRSLHNINVSLGTLLAAMKELSMLRGAEISPDGMLGGRGFIMSFREIKGAVNGAINGLSDVTDTLADELTNPGWGLSQSEVKKVKKEKEEIEEEVEDTQADMGKEPSNEEPVEKEAEDESVISPDDVKDSADVESLKKYQGLIEGNAEDKVANVLSRNIMANLTKGG